MTIKKNLESGKNLKGIIKQSNTIDLANSKKRDKNGKIIKCSIILLLSPSSRILFF